MNTLIRALILGIPFFLSINSARAEETVGEKLGKNMKTVNRSLKKGAHRVRESLCMKGDLKCAEMRVKHRTQEGKDIVVDKASEIKNKLDSEKK